MIKDLIAASAADNLEEYVSHNINQLYDYFTWGTSSALTKDIQEIQQFTTTHRRKILALTINGTNLTFLALLLQAAERLRLESAFEYLFSFLSKNGYDVGNRMKAAAIFMINVREANVLLEHFDSIYDLLQNSFDNEEDDADILVATMLNYYTTGILNCASNNIKIPRGIKQKIEEKNVNHETSFLSRPTVRDIIAVDITPGNYPKEVDIIHNFIDDLLNRGPAKGIRKNGFLLEQGTNYTSIIEKHPPIFTNIRGVCVDRYKGCGDLHSALSQGTKILDSECELYGYMYSYGKMHYAKLLSALKELPTEIFSEHKPNIIDWGCGQGMASITLLEYLSINTIQQNFSSVLLIEPSVIALERASFHIKHYNSKLKPVTINKDFDALDKTDFNDIKGSYHLHLFSNILDMDFYSLDSLINIIKQRFKGENYFIVVSPFVNKTRTDRIDLFVNSFSIEKGFKKISKDINESKGNWQKTSWTRVQRIFYANID